MLRLELVDPSDRDWKRMDLFDDRVIFQTREWIEFLAAGGGGEPVIAAVKDGSDLVGYFSGLAVRRFGVPMLGSPLRGWSTWYLGFNLRPGVPRHAAVEALMSFALNDLRWLHVPVVSVAASRYRALSQMRNVVRRGYRARQRVSGTLARGLMR
jgi:hypothetical protein